MKDRRPPKGIVIRGSKNIFTVRIFNDSDNDSEEKEIECRIKGKILKGVEGYYNPLAPGDVVEVEDGLILGVGERRNSFARFNQKGQAPQLLAANVDLVLCVTCPVSPPFRPRFLDRVLLQADRAGILPAVVCNKYDLVENGDFPDLDMEERLSEFERLGFPVFRLSALSGDGLDELKHFIAGKFSVLVGQSGVGKSSLVKALIPGLEIRIGGINEKFNRGNHTTTQAVLLDVSAAGTGANTRIIDTPGIRRFVPSDISAEDLVLYMREFAPLAGKCSYGLSCSHETEPGCKILEAVAAGVIYEDRYESFLRIRKELAGVKDYPDND